MDGADQQTGAHDEHHRQRDFGHDERATHVMASSAVGPSATALLERSHEVIDPSLREGREAEEHSRRHRHTERKEQNGQIDADFTHAGHAGRVRAEQRLDGDASDPQAQHAAGHA